MKQKKLLSFLAFFGTVFLFLIFYFLIYPHLLAPSKPKNYSGVIITLERTECYGTCPIYKLTLHGDGRVIYEGHNFVKVTSTQFSTISEDKFKELVNEFYKINYFTLKDEYYANITDLPTTITSITIDSKTKKVLNYYGAPKRLNELEDKIDEASNSKAWVGN